MNKMVIVLCILALSQTSFAQVGSTQSGGTQTTSVAPSSSINKNANSGKALQLIGAGTNAALAALMVKPCATGNTMSCVIAAMSAAQAASMLVGAGSAGKTAKATAYDFPTGMGGGTPGSGQPTACTFGPSCVDTDGDGRPDTQDTTSTFGGPRTDGEMINTISNQAKGVLGEMNKKGFKVNPDGTVTKPDGSKVSGSAFSSPSSMAAAGMSAEEISDFQNALSKAQQSADKARAVAIETEGGGGGGSAMGGSRKTASSGGGAGFDLSKLFGDKNKNDGKNKVGAGLTKQLGTDTIGVASDNMFEMVSRQYRKQESQQEFFAPAAAAAPAGAAVPVALPRKPGSNGY